MKNCCIRFGWLLALMTFQLTSQQALWRVDQPAQGPFGSQMAVIGDRDADGYDDLLAQVVLTSLSTVETWFFSGRDGQFIGRGAQAYTFYARAGDVDGDGIADYAGAHAQGAMLPQCAPWRCDLVEVRSGRNDALLWQANVPPINAGNLMCGDLDLDGDGGPDLLVGSSSVIVLPGINSVVYAFNRYGQLLYQVNSPPQESFLSVAKFIDFDRDGCDDFLLGLYEPTGRGACDIMSGRTGLAIRRVYGVPPVIWGYGATVAMAGDLDGDGTPDIILGDSGPFTPGVLEALGSRSGNLLYRWQVNQLGGDNFGWPHVLGDLDVDGDGIADVIADAWGQQGRGMFIYSGRDGSLIQNFTEPTGVPGGPFRAMAPRAGELFRRFVSRGGSYSFVSRIYMFSGAPPGVTQTGGGGRGTLAAVPRIGLRQFDTTAFRITLSGAEPNAPSLLVLGFSQPAVPYLDLNLLGFTGCTLFPYPDALGFTATGGTGIGSGYAAHDFRRGLTPTAVSGVSYRVFAQWITLGNGTTWPGGVSDAISLNVRF